VSARLFVIVGLALATYGVMFASARAADWALIRCEPGRPCVVREIIDQETACRTDLVGESIVAPKGTRLSCERVVPPKKETAAK